MNSSVIKSRIKDIKLKEPFDIIRKSFDPKYTGRWNGKGFNKTILLNTYIKEKYHDLFYTVPYTGLYLGYNREAKQNQLWILGFYKNGNRQVIKGHLDEISDYIKAARNTMKRFSYYNISHIMLDGGGHAISILYDRKTDELEVFDMNSESQEEFKKLRKKLKLLMEAIYHKGIKIHYLARCIRFGQLENEKNCEDYAKYRTKYFIPGPCLIWTLWYLELRLKNKQLSREQIIEKAIKQFTGNSNLVCRTIIGYAQFIEKFVNDYTIIYNNDNFTLKQIERKGVYSRLKLKRSLILKIITSLIISLGIYQLFTKKKLNL